MPVRAGHPRVFNGTQRRIRCSAWREVKPSNRPMLCKAGFTPASSPLTRQLIVPTRLQPPVAGRKCFDRVLPLRRPARRECLRRSGGRAGAARRPDPSRHNHACAPGERQGLTRELPGRASRAGRAPNEDGSSSAAADTSSGEGNDGRHITPKCPQVSSARSRTAFAYGRTSPTLAGGAPAEKRAGSARGLPRPPACGAARSAWAAGSSRSPTAPPVGGLPTLPNCSRLTSALRNSRRRFDQNRLRDPVRDPRDRL